MFSKGNENKLETVYSQIYKYIVIVFAVVFFFCSVPHSFICVSLLYVLPFAV